MKTLIRIIPILLLINLSSCEERGEPLFGTIDMMTFITVVDRQGNNLLNPSNVGSYKPKDIKIFYEINGEMIEFFEGNLDMPRNFRIDPPEFESDYIMALVVGAEKTVIQWNETETDTLQAEIFDDGRSLIVLKVYHQGELKWDGATSKTGRGLTIIK
jgi:hypothetical protein